MNELVRMPKTPIINSKLIKFKILVHGNIISISVLSKTNKLEFFAKHLGIVTLKCI